MRYGDGQIAEFRTPRDFPDLHLHHRLPVVQIHPVNKGEGQCLNLRQFDEIINEGKRLRSHRNCSMLIPDGVILNQQHYLPP